MFGGTFLTSPLLASQNSKEPDNLLHFCTIDCQRVSVATGLCLNPIDAFHKLRNRSALSEYCLNTRPRAPSNARHLPQQVDRASNATSTESVLRQTFANRLGSKCENCHGAWR